MKTELGRRSESKEIKKGVSKDKVKEEWRGSKGGRGGKEMKMK